MTTSADLHAVTDFPCLVAYLRDELEWEIPEDLPLEKLTYNYTADELGLELNAAVEIRQLRPLQGHTESWGVFFIDFDKEAIPVGMLRLLLASVSRKQRASANPGDRALFDKNDLLFVSAFGKAEERQLALAHFHQEPDSKALPTLRVIEWKPGDSRAQLERRREQLAKLRWPEGDEPPGLWRTRWSEAFVDRPREAIRTSKEMAEALAEAATAIRRTIEQALPRQKDTEPLAQLFTAMKETLNKDLNVSKFADTYAQTIAYGLLAKRFDQILQWTKDKKKTPGSDLPKPTISVEDLEGALPTNPFLTELLASFLEAVGRNRERSGVDFDALGIGDLLHLLNTAQIDAVLADFDQVKQGEDPVIRFYEDFFEKYDKKTKVQRGVFYTPKPVVSFIVRSVDKVLRTELGLPLGLADTTTWGEFAAAHPNTKIPDGVKRDEPFVKVLDPATGTGTFLVEVIDLIHRRMVDEAWDGRSAEEKRRLWNDYVPRHLLPRLYGYELMMAPYAVAHMKIGLKLAETGYDFSGMATGPDGVERPVRARVFLTNALAPAQDLDMQLAFMNDALAHEARAANEAKARVRFTAVLGNPPYSKISSNLDSAAVKLVEPFRHLDGDRIVERGALALEMALQDDYLKFFSKSAGDILQAGYGCCGLITNFRFLSAPMLRGVRCSILGWFDSIEIINLGGQVSERQAGTIDENVFDIEQGVSVSILRKTQGEKRDPKYHRILGSRNSKYEFLSRGEVTFVDLQPRAPMYSLTSERSSNESEYESWWPLVDAMPFNSGAVITSRDSILISFDEIEGYDKIVAFSKADLSDASATDKLGFSIKEKWDADSAQRAISTQIQSGTARSHLEKIRYRPFDDRTIYYDTKMIDTPSRPVHAACEGGNNIILLTPKVKNSEIFTHASVSVTIAEKKAASHDRATQMFPLYNSPELGGRRLANFSREFLSDLGGEKPPEDVFGFIYAILHSPQFRARYGRKLMDDFPRIPIPEEGALFAKLSPLGARLVSLHLLDSAHASILNDPAVRFVANNNPPVVGRFGKEVRRDTSGRVYVNDQAWFATVPRHVWEYTVGGYQPAQKWLKDRGQTGSSAKLKEGRLLTSDDILHYRRMIVALDETVTVMAEIDRVIDQHGGWPGAFRGISDS